MTRKWYTVLEPPVVPKLLLVNSSCMFQNVYPFICGHLLMFHQDILTSPLYDLVLDPPSLFLENFCM